MYICIISYTKYTGALVKTNAGMSSDPTRDLLYYVFIIYHHAIVCRLTQPSTIIVIVTMLSLGVNTNPAESSSVSSWVQCEAQPKHLLDGLPLLQMFYQFCDKSGTFPHMFHVSLCPDATR